MKVLVRIFAIIWGTVWYTFASLTVLIAVSFSLLRLFLPLINQYSITIENYISDIVGQPVKIQSLDAEWHGFGPSLVFENVRLLNKSSTSTTARFSQAKLGLDIMESLSKWQISFNSLVLIGADLSLVRHKDGRVTMTDFDFSSPVSDTDQSEQFLPTWLLGHRKVLLEVKNLIFEDKKHNHRRSHFSDISVLLRNQNDRHIIDSVLTLSSSVDEKLVFSMDVEGDVLSSNSWRGRFYLSGNKLDLSGYADEMQFLNANIGVGRASFKLWGEWNEATLTSIKGEVSANKVIVSNSNTEPDIENDPVTMHKPFVKDEMSARVQWQKTGDGWSFLLDQLRLMEGTKLWPESQLSVDYHKTSDQSSVAINTNYVDVVPVMEVVANLDIKDAQLKNTLVGLNPKGIIRNISVHVEHTDDLNFDISGQFENLSTQAWKKAPGLTQLNGQFKVNKSSGVIVLDSKNATVDLPYMFRSTLTAAELNGSIGFKRSDSSWLIESNNLSLSNQDANAKLAMSLNIPLAGGSPELHLISNFKNGIANQAPKYLPVNVLPKNALTWLDRAFKGGFIKTGGLVFHGAVNNFPFTDGTGVFEVRFDLERGELDYAEDWPVIKEIDTTVIFRGSSVATIVKSARLLNSDISNTIVEIPDMTRKKALNVSIRGNVEGTTQDKINFIRIAPKLREEYGNLLSTISASGSSDLDLDIELAIANKQVSSEITGSIQFRNNNFDHKTLGNIFGEVSGNVEILPIGFRTDGLSTNLFGQHTVIEIDTLSPTENDELNYVGIKALGKFDAEDISEQYMPALTDLISGSANFQLALNLPLKTTPLKTSASEPVIAETVTSDNTNDKITPLNNYIQLKLESDLEGVEIKLPPPFNKTKDEAKKLIIDTKLKLGDKVLYKFHFADRLNAITEMVHKKNKMRGEIRFGEGAVFLPNEQGLRLVGHLEHYSFDVWKNLMDQVNHSLQKKQKEKKSNSKLRRVQLSDYINSANLSVDEFELFGQKVSKLNLKIEKQDERLFADINSKELKGKVRMPKFIESEPIEMELDYWRLSSNTVFGGPSRNIDPRSIPAIDAFCKSVTYKNRKFGSVRLKTTKIVEGLRLEQLIVEPRSTSISAVGKWIIQGEQQTSSFKLHLDSQNLGETMTDLDYVNSIAGGKGTIDASFHWPGMITNINLEQLQGDVKLNFTDGRLLDVDPGQTGRRMFGLFSLQTLPKRLMLDFSDVYNKGFTFDLIEGDFNIDSGDAYTSNFYMLSSAGKVSIAGRIGLSAQDYDQKMVFTPHTADMVSIIGLILLPGMPWGFIIPQMFRDNINNAINFTYVLSGEWDNPVIEPVMAELEDPDADLFQ